MTWGTIKLGEVVTHRKGSIIIENDHEYKLCRVQLHRKGVVLRSNTLGSNIKTKKQQVCKSGDFLVAEMDAKVGGYGFVPEELEGAIVSSHYFLFELNKEKILPEYLEMISQLLILQDQIKAVGSTNYAAIRPINVLNWEIPICGIEKQALIVSKYINQRQQSEGLNSELTHQLTLVKQLRQSFLREAMQGKLTADFRSAHPELIEGENSAQALLEKIKAEKQDLLDKKIIKKGTLQDAEVLDELMFEIPNHWTWCKLDEICKNITDGTHQTPNYTTSGRIFLSAQNVKPFRFMPEEHKFVSEEAYQTYISNRKPEVGDLLIGRVGAGIGETAVIDQDIEFCIYVSLGLIQPFKEYVNSYYLAYVFNSSYGVKYAKGNISSKGGSAGNFNLGRIRSFLIPLPPLSEQQAIVSKLDELMRTCDELEASIRSSQQQNEMLLREVLREALEEKKVEPVLQTVSATRKSNISERTILAAYLIRRFNSAGFGRVMLMKLLFLVEYICQIDFESKYVVNVAGPYDDLILEIESKLRRYGIYDARKNKIDNHVRYHEMMGVATVDELFEEKFSGEKEQIESIISTFKKAKWEQCEIVATLYAVWNNRIIKGQLINDLALKQDFLNWDPHKQKYTDRLDSALDWMRVNNIIPAGWGSVIEK